MLAGTYQAKLKLTQVIPQEKLVFETVKFSSAVSTYNDQNRC